MQFVGYGSSSSSSSEQ